MFVVRELNAYVPAGGLAMPAPEAKTIDSELDAPIDVGTRTFTVRLLVVMTGGVVHETPFTETYEAVMLDGTVVPAGNASVIVSFGARAPWAPVVVAMV